jgi:hypothetical protein
MPTISVTEAQFLAIANAAAALCPQDRDRFYAAVAAELEGKPIGDGTIGCTIRAAQLKFQHPEPDRQPSRWGSTAPKFEKKSKDAA